MKEKILIVEDQFVEADYLRSMLEEKGYIVTGIARSYTKALELIAQERPGFVLLDIFLKGKQTGIDLAGELSKEKIPFVYLSANSTEDILAAAKTTQPYGFLVKPFRERDLIATLEIARYRHEQSVQYKEKSADDLFSNLKQLISEPLDSQQKLLKLATILQRSIPFDYLSIGTETGFLRVGYDEYQPIGLQELRTITGKAEKELITIPYSTLIRDTFQMVSELNIPLQPAALSLFSRRQHTYDTTAFEHIQPVLSEALSVIMRIPLDPAKQSTSPEKASPGEAFSGMIGKSHLLLNVFDLISQVAYSDTSVLILGDSGTGKEGVANCIHQLSGRSGKPFIKVNCAALPPNLIESELFGHEKGAFTGAYDKRIGKFEKAHTGTIFLDEIGELPMESQVKLLRVLQEKEIERVGGKEPIKVDVRIIAATNRNLEKEVAEGRFRLDMYYRLNVYPIVLPPLRQRKEDIPLLAEHFIRIYNQKAGKKITGLSEKVLKDMMNYAWPGNIRELEHLIERGVLLAKGTTIESTLVPHTDANDSAANTGDRLKTIHENERDHILAVLRKCNGRVWGAGGAAEILNIPPSTLKSKMKKLGIKKEYTP